LKNVETPSVSSETTIHTHLHQWLAATRDLQTRLRIHAHDHGTASDYKTCLNLIADMDPMVRRAEALERAWKRMEAQAK
jgi:hypothetical protein